MLGKPVIFRANSGSPDFTINDRASQLSNYSIAPYYYISLDSVDGLRGSDISYESYPVPNDTGDKSGDIFRRGKSITLTGTIWSRGYAELDEAADYLEQMFWETLPRKLIWYPLNSATQIYVTARVINDLSIPMSKDGQRRWSWTVGLRADNPRFYKLSDNTIFKTWQT